MSKPRFRLISQSGQAVAEFAIVLPVFLLLLLGIAQLGIVFNNYVTLMDATRAGARKAAVSRRESNPTAVTKAAVKASASNLSLSDPQITVTSTWQPGANVTVCSQYPYAINLIGVVVKSGNLNSCTTERVE